MKKITISLNQKSIKSALYQVRSIEKAMPKIIYEFYNYLAGWIINAAERYVSLSDIGSLVKQDISKSWHIYYSDDKVKIVNDSEKAVYVEFGVGVVGQEQAHPNATAEGYEYNMDSKSKSIDGSWTFFTNSEELDLPQNALLAHNWYNGKRGKGGEKGKRLLIMTRGAKGVWYAYNAVVDAKNELSKPNGGEIGRMWQDIVRRNIG